jgi:hypothetical protein
MHNSGFPNIHFVLAVVLMTPSGIGYGFGRDHALDGTVTLFGRNRDDDWTDTGANQQLVGKWDQVARAQLQWRLVAFDTLTHGIQGLVEDLVKDAAQQLGKVGSLHRAPTPAVWPRCVLSSGFQPDGLRCSSNSSRSCSFSAATVSSSRTSVDCSASRPRGPPDTRRRCGTAFRQGVARRPIDDAAELGSQSVELEHLLEGRTVG